MRQPQSATASLGTPTESLEQAPASTRRYRLPAFVVVLVLLVLVLSLLFFKSLHRGYTLFSNDGPLASLLAAPHRLPDRFKGAWQDLNSIGYREPGAWPSVTFGLQLLLGPVDFSKFYAPTALLILGLGAWTFFQALKLRPAACILGALAATLNSGFFSAACWGVAAHPITIGLSYFALAALVKSNQGHTWLKVAIAGAAVGLGVADGADIGIIFSGYVAAFALYQSLVAEGKRPRNLALGLGRVAVMAGCAALVAAQAVAALIGTQIQGVAGANPEEQNKEARWDWATQWSLPKRETLNLIIPGLFGYRTDSPGGAQYWGAAGRAPAWDRYFENGGTQPNALLRFTGGGNYAGILVVLVATWAALQGLRNKRSEFLPVERKFARFWIGVAFVSLLLAFGRYAPFYRLLYLLPYSTSFRNPAKFTHVVNWALVVLFAYGVHGLSRRYLANPIPTPAEPKKARGWDWPMTGFDRGWIIGCGIAFGACVLGWLLYALARPSLEAYLQTVGFDEALARAISRFSLGEGAWFLLFFALAGGLVAIVMSGWFAGAKARLAPLLLGCFLFIDLGRANQPWIVYWNYPAKYASNPVIDILKTNPSERRVAILPNWLPSGFSPPQAVLDQEQEIYDVYRAEWAQQLFPYYNIQSLDVVQMSRMPEDLAGFQGALRFHGTRETLFLIPRNWQLTGTGYLLGPAAALDMLNRGVDGNRQRFEFVQRFGLELKPGILKPTSPADFTAVAATNGPFALMRFTGALPRARLYGNWLVDTNPASTLEKLSSPNFDPAETVLVSSPPPASPAPIPNTDAGSVHIVSYEPKRVLLRADAKVPSVLLLNDKFDPNWIVTVDGKPESLLHCNYIMRGVQVLPGAHEILFSFQPPVFGLYVSLASLVAAVGLVGFLAATRNPGTSPTQTRG